MRIAVLDDYQRVFTALEAAHALAGHEVVTFSDPVRSPAEIAARLEAFDAVILTQQRMKGERCPSRGRTGSRGPRNHHGVNISWHSTRAGPPRGVGTEHFVSPSG